MCVCFFKFESSTSKFILSHEFLWIFERCALRFRVCFLVRYCARGGGVVISLCLCANILLVLLLLLLL